ncbi:band 7 protein AGAP004871 isoform X5 [Andrena cerasifolii]
MPCVDNCVRVDMRTVSFDVPPQEVLTKDSVTVSVDAVVYYRIKEPLNAVIKIANYSHSTRLLAASTLRTVLGTRSLAEILAERETVSHTMQASLDEATDPWGVKVERVEIKDVRLPVQLQRAMATEAEAAREARAKVIAAEGEMLASRALKEASDVISTSPAALQRRGGQRETGNKYTGLANLPRRKARLMFHRVQIFWDFSELVGFPGFFAHPHDRTIFLSRISLLPRSEKCFPTYKIISRRDGLEMGELCCLEFYVFKPGSTVQLFGRHKPKKKRDRSFL